MRKVFSCETLIVATFAKLDLLDILEEAVSKQGEKGVYIRNNLNGPIFINFDCDRRVVKSETTEISAELGLELEKVGGNVGAATLIPMNI